MRASFVCLRKVSKVESACSGKWSLRVRIGVVSRQNYDKNSPGYIAHGSSYQNTIFSTQISLGLLILCRMSQYHAMQNESIACQAATMGGLPWSSLDACSRLFGKVPASCAPSPVCPARLLDHLIGQEEQRGGHRDPQRLGGLAVDDQLECPVLLHGDVAHLDTLEDFVHLGCQAGRTFLPLRPVGQEAPSLRKPSVVAYGWEPIPDS